MATTLTEVLPASDPPDGRTCPCPRDGWHSLCAIHRDRNPELLAALAAYLAAAQAAPEPASVPDEAAAAPTSG